MGLGDLLPSLCVGDTGVFGVETCREGVVDEDVVKAECDDREE